jgi:hypothetical protein
MLKHHIETLRGYPAQGSEQKQNSPGLWPRACQITDITGLIAISFSALVKTRHHQVVAKPTSTLKSVVTPWPGQKHVSTRT